MQHTPTSTQSWCSQIKSLQHKQNYKNNSKTKAKSKACNNEGNTRQMEISNQGNLQLVALPQSAARTFLLCYLILYRPLRASLFCQLECVCVCDSALPALHSLQMTPISGFAFALVSMQQLELLLEVHVCAWVVVVLHLGACRWICGVVARLSGSRCSIFHRLAVRKRRETNFVVNKLPFSVQRPGELMRVWFYNEKLAKLRWMWVHTHTRVVGNF